MHRPLTPSVLDAQVACMMSSADMAGLLAWTIPTSLSLLVVLAWRAGVLGPPTFIVLWVEAQSAGVFGPLPFHSLGFQYRHWGLASLDHPHFTVWWQHRHGWLACWNHLHLTVSADNSTHFGGWLTWATPCSLFWWQHRHRGLVCLNYPHFTVLVAAPGE